jgi:putative hemolysin
VHTDCGEADLKRIPAAGPLVVVANHPFGGVDGLVLAALVERIRPDAKLLVSYLLACIPEMGEISFFVDPFGGPAARSRNRQSLAAAARWLKSGGALLTFPAGEVSHLSFRSACVTDPPWSDSIARLVHRTRATVVPAYVDGRNGGAFQLAGLVHPRLRTALLPRELANKAGRSIRLEWGSPIPFSRLERLIRLAGPASRMSRANVAPLTEYLRLRTYILRGRIEPSRYDRNSATTDRPAKPAVPISPAQPADVVASEIDSLSEGHRLAECGPFQVFCAAAADVPVVLREIGRLRELTFRQVGEGTGREIDLDRFDDYYLHLFAWDRERRTIVGAYRLGPTDEILPRRGASGLYTSTLFEFRPPLLGQINPALELGRSFVTPEYQRDFAPLMLLWKGIGRFVAMRPRYRRLFGAVSISDEYHTMTKQLLMAFLRANCFNTELAELVRPRNPPRLAPPRDVDARRLSALVADMGNVQELVEEIESGGRGVPVLLRQYLKLNAKVLGFNIDPDFGDVIDGLVLADLAAVDRAILDRFMGKAEAAGFLAHHRSGNWL